MRSLFVAGAAFLLSISRLANAQMPLAMHLADSSAESILDHIGGDVSLLVPILRQEGPPQPAEKLAAIADSLEGIALAAPIQVDHNGLRAQQRAGVEATAVLGQAGDPTPGLSGKSETPFAAALDWLISIHQEATNLAVRTTALDQMLVVGGRSRAIPYLLKTATSLDPTAEEAMHLLTLDIDPHGGVSHATAAERAETESALHQLWNRVVSKHPVAGELGAAQASVPDEEALGTLALFARTHGWSKEP